MISGCARDGERGLDCALGLVEVVGMNELGICDGKRG